MVAAAVPGFFAHEGHYQSKDFKDRLVERTTFLCHVSTQEGGLVPSITLRRVLPDGPIAVTTKENDND